GRRPGRWRWRRATGPRGAARRNGPSRTRSPSSGPGTSPPPGARSLARRGPRVRRTSWRLLLDGRCHADFVPQGAPEHGGVEAIRLPRAQERFDAVEAGAVALVAAGGGEAPGEQEAPPDVVEDGRSGSGGAKARGLHAVVVAHDRHAGD